MNDTGKGINYFSLIGKVVQFTDTINTHYEVCFDSGMLARVIDVKPNVNPEVLEIIVDHSEFLNHNRPLMKPDFYDRDGKPNQTWEQSGFMKSDFCEKIFVMQDSEKHLPPFIEYIDHK